MSARLGRIILYVRDAERLSEFYRQTFDLEIVQHDAGEWVVLKAGDCELALFQITAAYQAPPGGWRGETTTPSSYSPSTGRLPKCGSL